MFGNTCKENESNSANYIAELIRKATDSDEVKRAEVADSEFASAEILARLASDPSELVVMNAAGNKKTPIESLNMLLNHDSPYVQIEAKRTIWEISENIK